MDRLFMELLTDPLGLPVNDLWEYGMLAVIGVIAFAVGWELSPGGVFGAVIHWVARLLTFFILWAVAYILLAVAQWVMAHLVLVCGTVVMAVAVIVIATVTRPHRL